MREIASCAVSNASIFSSYNSSKSKQIMAEQGTEYSEKLKKEVLRYLERGELTAFLEDGENN